MDSPFHLAFPVSDIEVTRSFYTEIIGCSVGREAARWIDFNFFGHQISAHLVETTEDIPTNPVDGESIPVRHFGLVLEWNAWHQLVERLNKKEVNYLIKPTTRFEGEVGEQATFFISDPSGNALEFKSFKDREQLFATT
ncbi:MAG TPA: glyoxalase [Thiotrichaceae bacterium]|jgi:extradiol dioxygenase family protein|nr:glyoxalase [Thiotrichaceae bacterium]HIM09042.1 glyoxalase [Gammaproteobacteria bacterium]